MTFYSTVSSILLGNFKAKPVDIVISIIPCKCQVVVVRYALKGSEMARQTVWENSIHMYCSGIPAIFLNLVISAMLKSLPNIDSNATSGHLLTCGIVSSDT